MHATDELIADPTEDAPARTPRPPERSGWSGNLLPQGAWPLRLLAGLVLVDAALYCFTWPRIPTPSVEVPVQRVVVWATLAAAVIAVPAARRRAAHLGLARLPLPVRLMLAALVALVSVVAAGFPLHHGEPGFETMPWLMDLVKYCTAFGLLVVVFFVLRWRLVSLDLLARAVVLSSLLCTAVSYAMLVAYLLGFRYGNDTFFRAYGDAFGVWPTDSLLPRLVGTSTEPQQLSILFVTGLLLMVRSGRPGMWASAVAGLGVLLLSQSKFSLVSIVVVLIYAFVSIGRRHGWRRRTWTVAVAVAVAAAGIGASFVLRLPVFAMTLQQGVRADAVSERLQNAGILTGLIRDYPLFGIGSGQYGIYRGYGLGTGPDPAYYPNNDYLKVFAELGGLGLVLFATVLAVPTLLLVRAQLVARHTQRPLPPATWPFAIGAALILANMAVGYEMLHVFLWLNVAAVLFAVTDGRAGGPVVARSKDWLRRAAPAVLVGLVAVALVGGAALTAPSGALGAAARLPTGASSAVDSSVQYDGDWTVSRADRDGTLGAWSGTDGASATVSFDGSQIELFGNTAPGGGIARVSVDSGPAYEVDFFSPVAATAERLWVSAPAAPGAHVLHVVVTGEQRDTATGSVVSLSGFHSRDDARSIPLPSGVDLQGRWTRSMTTLRGASSLAFEFRGVAVLLEGALVGRASGTYSIDGAPERPITRSGQTLWASGVLPSGAHRVRIDFMGAVRVTRLTSYSTVMRLATATSRKGGDHGWQVYSGNPVLGKNWGTAFDLAAVTVNGGYRMWFSWRPRSAIAFAESVDGISWTAPRVVLKARPVTWEADVNRPSVLQAPDGTWRMWYTGQRDGVSAIGEATSADGQRWTRVSTSPALTPTRKWEQPSVMNPSVLWDGREKTYKMWYSGGQTEEPNVIGYATSRDGSSWKRVGSEPVLQRDVSHGWEKDRVAGIQVIQRSPDDYLAFYIGYRDLYTAAVGIARSTDGVHWSGRQATPILSSVAGGWTCSAVYKPFALYDAGQDLWRLWFNGRCDAPEQLGLAVRRGAEPVDW